MASASGNAISSLSEESVTEFIQTQKNPRTQKKTSVDTKKFVQFISESPYNVKVPIEELPPEHLDYLVKHFLLEIRKADGSEYEPDTLTSYRNSIDRYLREKKYSYSMITAQEFTFHREVLQAKRKQLRSDGLGKKPNARKSLTDADKVKLLESKQLSIDSPATLLNIVWYNNSMFFGLRGFQEHYDLKWSDIQLKQTSDGKQFLEYGERTSKTRNGESSNNDRKINPKAYATNTDTCPVKAYLAYKEHRPLEMQKDQSPFYLAIIYKPLSNVWFKNSRMGQNKLQSILKDMAKCSGLTTPNISNHSARKTLITSLRDKKVPPTDIIQLTGHKRLESILSYDVLSESNQENMSSLIANTVGNTGSEMPNFSIDIIPQQTPPTVAPQVNQSENTLASTTIPTTRSGIFSSGSVVKENKINITFVSGDYYNSAKLSDSSPKRPLKRCRRIIESDSSQE